MIFFKKNQIEKRDSTGIAKVGPDIYKLCQYFPVKFYKQINHWYCIVKMGLYCQENAKFKTGVMMQG